MSRSARRGNAACLRRRGALREHECMARRVGTICRPGRSPAHRMGPSPSTRLPRVSRLAPAPSSPHADRRSLRSRFVPQPPDPRCPGHGRARAAERVVRTSRRAPRALRERDGHPSRGPARAGGRALGARLRRLRAGRHRRAHRGRCLAIAGARARVARRTGSDPAAGLRARRGATERDPGRAAARGGPGGPAGRQPRPRRRPVPRPVPRAGARRVAGRARGHGDRARPVPAHERVRRARRAGQGRLAAVARAAARRNPVRRRVRARLPHDAGHPRARRCRRERARARDRAAGRRARGRGRAARPGDPGADRAREHARRTVPQRALRARTGLLPLAGRAPGGVRARGARAAEAQRRAPGADRGRQLRGSLALRPELPRLARGQGLRFLAVRELLGQRGRRRHLPQRAPGPGLRAHRLHAESHQPDRRPGRPRLPERAHRRRAQLRDRFGQRGRRWLQLRPRHRPLGARRIDGHLRAGVAESEQLRERGLQPGRAHQQQLLELHDRWRRADP